MWKHLLAAAALLAPTMLAAQPAGPRFRLERIAPPSSAGAIPLYPAGSPPKPQAAENWDTLIGDFPDGTHMSGRIVRNVSEPTITPVLPDPAKATGAAVLVAPGGAFLSLSMDSEGFQIAHWLADHGVAAFVLKYRLNPTPTDDQAFMRVVAERMAPVAATGEVADISEPRAPQDALRALALLRSRAAGWRIDPARVGMIGFSAGAMTTLQAVLTGSGADRPAFFGYIYGPMRAIAVPAGAPPMFAALALDDPLFGRQGFGIVEAWHKAGVPVELHAYTHGDHGFGMGRPGTTTTLVLDEFRLWLATQGFLGKAK
ncbi:alpha/beta hydrolase [Sphingomonas nostoxanthinifaciens]|uniref:alpha/beta hydrolase n=1 Tax=Sphingomonas nostoxanthinifaciens TaxID=2872652 RepID=UPI001CC1FC29|nr:alpha/beta hydrolase [Sphingomonas nostoxanthinifaciens]UAK22872.1 alpha/beta hydrolase [Sphingomonas nostoxanthinifaciens]